MTKKYSIIFPIQNESNTTYNQHLLSVDFSTEEYSDLLKNRKGMIVNSL
jgi:hypothetical protein